MSVRKVCLLLAAFSDRKDRKQRARSRANCHRVSQVLYYIAGTTSHEMHGSHGHDRYASFRWVSCRSTRTLPAAVASLWEDHVLRAPFPASMCSRSRQLPKIKPRLRLIAATPALVTDAARHSRSADTSAPGSRASVDDRAGAFTARAHSTPLKSSPPTEARYK